MSIYRFLIKIPLQIYAIAFLPLVYFAYISFPVTQIVNNRSTFYINKWLNKFLFKLAEILNIDLSIILLLTGLLVILGLIFVNVKIIKYKFYDLNVTAPIVLFLFTGPILFSLFGDLNYLISGFLTLVIFYFQSRYLDSQKINDFILLVFFSFIALVFNNYYFLFIITILTFVKIANFQITNLERINIISKITIIYLLFFIFIIINLIKQSPIIFITNLTFNALIEKSSILLLMFLPLLGFFINSLFFNLFKKINWNKDLILFLILGIFSFAIYLCLNINNLSPLIFGSALLTIYIFRTLEFVEFKWTKIFYLAHLLMPISLIMFDISLYQSLKNIPYLNYIFYVALILVGLINPFFFFEKQSSVEVLKISLFSIYLNALLLLTFVFFQYKDHFTETVINTSIEKDFNCKLETTKIIIENINLNLSLSYLEYNGNIYINNSCKILIKLSSLDTIPIDNQESLNKTVLDLQLKKFININLSKI